MALVVTSGEIVFATNRKQAEAKRLDATLRREHLSDCPLLAGKLLERDDESVTMVVEGTRVVLQPQVL